MGNTISQGHRRCGLCYFKLKPETPFLDEPGVSRRTQPVWPVPSWEDGRLDDELKLHKGIKIVELKTKLIAFRTSSQRGCVGCATVLKCLEDQVQERGFSLDQTCWQGDCKVFWLVGDRVASHPSLQIELKPNIGGNIYKKEAFSVIIGYTGWTYHPAHPAARKVSRAVAQGYTGSPASLRNLKTWLKDCDSSHQVCKQPASSLPYRILELSRGSNNKITVRLTEDSKIQEPYACLSHRWGPSTHCCRTTLSTISTHLKSVPWVNLPKTFQQAAEVVLYLGLKYLWIDSLCIIQDDKNDWKVQAAQMCSIYQGSYLTIAATSCGDSDDGLFRTVPRTPIQIQDPSCRKLFISKSSVHFSNSQSIISDASAIADFPLLTRGWVYQERLLAPRVVHFSRYELKFECVRPKTLCECGANKDWFEKHKHNRTLAESKLAVTEISARWHEIVSEFSALGLTYHSDYLPALAGIARQYGTAHRNVLGRYVAGFWEHTLANDLLWYVGNGYKSKWPDACCAPTWSWASKQGGVGTLGYERTADDLEVVDFNIDLAGLDEYGPVNSAELILRGYLVSGSWKWGVGKGGQERIHFYIHGKSVSHYIHIDYDFSISGNSRHVPEGSPIYCLKTGFVGAGCHVCLMLRAVDLKNRVFERIGLLQEAGKDNVNDWFKDNHIEGSLKLV